MRSTAEPLEGSPFPTSKGFDRRWLILAVTSIGSFMSILDSNIVNIAIPSILRDFHADLSQGQLIVTVYLLALAIVIPVSGFLGDKVGMKRLYMITLAGFTVSSALCGLAWNMESLIAFRALQGFAGGMLQPLGMAIVFTTITPLERPKFMAVLGLPTLLAPLLGPTLGGYLIEFVNWRFIFLINMPIGLLNLAAAYMLLKETTLHKESRLDSKGFLFSSIAFPCLLLGLSQGEDLGWGSPVVLGLLGVGAVCLTLFIITELSQADPMLRLQLFGNRMFTLALLIVFINVFILFGIQYVLPLFLQQAHSVGAAKTGLILLPGGFTSFITMTVAGQFYNRIGPRPLVVGGMVVMLVTTVALSMLSATTSVYIIAAMASLRGLALGLTMPTIQTVAFNCVPLGQTSRAAAMVNGFQRMISSVTTATLTTILVAAVGWHGAPGTSIARGTAPLDVTVASFHDAFHVMSAVSLVGLVLAVFVADPVLAERNRTLREEQQQPAREPVGAASKAS